MTENRLREIAADVAYLRGCGSRRMPLPLDEVDQLVAEVRRLRSAGGRT
jgi:HAMP domain-containing protein